MGKVITFAEHGVAHPGNRNHHNVWPLVATTVTPLQMADF